VEETPEGALDLFLHIHTPPVTMARLLDRRAQIAALYRELLRADVVVITLGLVECWWDRAHRCYLNKAPSKAFVSREPERFEFHQMDVPSVHARMSRAIGLLREVTKARILLTVSPVPVEATFMPQNIVMSNSYSKSVLRVAAEMLVREHGNVDYFPSYEIVTGPQTGARFYAEDLREVTPEGVAYVMALFRRHCLTGAPEAAAAPPPPARATTPAAAVSAEERARYAALTQVICDEEAIVMPYVPGSAP
jgi:hypothetical protein